MNPNLRGRETLLDQIADGLDRHPIAILHGLGGVGKTQVAFRYAVQNAPSYSVIWTIPSTDPVAIEARLLELAVVLQVSEGVAPDKTLVLSAVRRWLDEHDGWLLVLDAAESPDQVRPYLPMSPRGHVIITSTNAHWRALGRLHKVRPLSQREGTKYLLGRSGDTDRVSASELAVELGGLPLALEQAGAYCEVAQKPLSEYLALYRRTATALLSAGPAPSDHPLSVPVTVAIATTAMARRSSTASELVKACSLLSPDPIPIELFGADGCLVYPPSEEGIAAEMRLDGALHATGAYSLVERRGDLLIVHRLVQDVIRDAQPDDEIRVWLRRLTTTVRRLLPEDALDPDKWVPYQRLFTHGIRLCKLAEQSDQISPDVLRLLDRLATFVQYAGSYSEAAEIFDRAFSLAESILGRNDPVTLSALNNLGACLHHVDLKGSLSWLTECVNRYESSLGDGAHRTAGYGEALQNLGYSLWRLGLLDEAERRMRAALLVYEEAIPANEWANQLPIAHLLNNIGLIAWSRGDWDDAWELWSKAYALNLAHYGEDHVEVATGLNNRGVVLMERGDLDSALEAQQSALAIRERQLGRNHPLVGHSLREIASVLRQQFEVRKDSGILNEALTLDERARTIAEDRFVSPHPEIAFAMNCQALDLQRLGRVDEAEALLLGSLSIYEEYYSAPHLDIVRSLSNLGRVQLQQGEIENARQSLERAVNMGRRLGAHRSVHVGRALDGLGEVHRRRGDPARAVGHFTDALRLFEAVLGPDAPTTRNTRSKLEELQNKVV